jgi:hypothetical protein
VVGVGATLATTVLGEQKAFSFSFCSVFRYIGVVALDYEGPSIILSCY